MERRMDYDIRRYKVMLYSKTYCKYSKGIKQILAKYTIDDMKTVELDLEPYMEEMQVCSNRILYSHYSCYYLHYPAFSRVGICKMVR